MPKSILTRSSDFFKKCCSSDWKEGYENKVSLPEVDSSAFQSYLQWLYVKELVATDEIEEEDVRSKSEKIRQTIAKEAYGRLGDLAILADMLLDLAFGNAIVDVYFKTAERTCLYPSIAQASAIFDVIAGSSNFKRLMVDWYSTVPVQFLRENESSTNAAMLFDIMIRLREKGMYEDIVPRWSRRCIYHEHNEDVPKCKN